MAAILIVLALAALAVGLVVWNIRKKPADAPHAGPDESDTAWNDPVDPAPGAGAPTDDRGPRP